MGLSGKFLVVFSLFLFGSTFQSSVVRAESISLSEPSDPCERLREFRSELGWKWVAIDQIFILIERYLAAPEDPLLPNEAEHYAKRLSKWLIKTGEYPEMTPEKVVETLEDPDKLDELLEELLHLDVEIDRKLEATNQTIEKYCSEPSPDDAIV